MPHDSWGRNLRTQVRKSVWDQFARKPTLRRRRGVRQRREGELYEVWECDDAAATQLLKGFQTVCGMCHHVNHYGMSTVLWRQGRLDLEGVDRHFLAGNQVGPRCWRSTKRRPADCFSAGRRSNGGSTSGLGKASGNRSKKV